MSTPDLPTLDTVNPESRPFLEGAAKQLGFVPNLLFRLSSSPPTLAAYLDLAKHFSKVGLSGIEMQSALLVAAIENGCAYCAAAHSTFATNVKIDPHVLMALREGRDTPDAKLNALAAFVRAVVRTQGHVAATELNRFTAAGYTNEQATGVLIAVAMKNIARIQHIMSVPLDQQFVAQRWEKSH